MQCLWSISRLKSLMRSFSQTVISLSYVGSLIYAGQLNRFDIRPAIMRAISASFVSVLQQLHSPINILMIDDN